MSKDENVTLTDEETRNRAEEKVAHPNWPPPSIDELAEKTHSRVEWICNGQCAKLVPIGPTVRLLVYKNQIGITIAWAKEKGLKIVKTEPVSNVSDHYHFSLRGEDVENQVLAHCCPCV
jgi:hypothetical protein